MKVTIEVGKLIAALKKHNPGADLTAVKAYLLDLTLDLPGNNPQYHEEEGFVPVETTPTPREPEPKPEYREEDSSVSENAALAGIVGPARTAGQPSVVDRVLPQKRVTVNRPAGGKPLDEKQKKRQEMNALSNMSSKEILEKIIPQGRRGEGNQFVEEGSDGGSGQSSGGGELEIG